MVKQQNSPRVQAPPAAIQLLIVDDHEMVRVGLRTMLEDTGDLKVVGEAATAGEALAEAIRLRPDVVLMDVRLPDGNGADACRGIRNACPDTRIVFLTSFTDELAVITAVAGGADGYLLKGISHESLIRAIKTVAAGHSILDPSVTQPILAKLQPHSVETPDPGIKTLSSQERSVLALVAEGKTNKEIATTLKLSDKTVKGYLSHAFRKLNVVRRSQAAVLFAGNPAKAIRP